MHEDTWWKRHKRAREEAIEESDNDDRGFRAGTDQSKDEDRGRKGAWNDHIHWPRIVSDEVRDDATEDRGRVQDRKDVEAERLICDAGGDGVEAQVEEWDVKAKIVSV